MAPASPRPALPMCPAPEPASSSGLRLKDLSLPAARSAGRYLLLDEIGSGGMASVHLARVDGPGGFQRWFAVKRIHAHFAREEQLVDMFLDEARTAACINHPNVVQVFEVGRDEETYWLAMEYLHGEPLRDVLRRAFERRLRIPPHVAARICADAAEGLHAAHELRGLDGSPLGLVHRDVSPHNLFITDDGRIKVVDFGIAKTAERLAQQTGAGVLKGKIAYMSPEQVRGAAVDRTTDVFALGVVLWEMTTGRRLFRADTDFETLTRLLECNVQPPSMIVPGYPPQLEACVLRALALRKEDRYPTAREMARDLERYLVQTGPFAGAEEVASLVEELSGDRIARRDARLTELSLREPSDPWATRAPPSLMMEDEEEAVTRVAIRPSSLDLGATMALPADFGPPSPMYAPPPAPAAPVALVPTSPYRAPPPVLSPPAALAPVWRKRGVWIAGMVGLLALAVMALALLAR